MLQKRHKPQKGFSIRRSGACAGYAWFSKTCAVSLPAERRFANDLTPQHKTRPAPQNTFRARPRRGAHQRTAPSSSPLSHPHSGPLCVLCLETPFNPSPAGWAGIHPLSPPRSVTLAFKHKPAAFSLPGIHCGFSCKNAPSILTFDSLRADCSTRCSMGPLRVQNRPPQRPSTGPLYRTLQKYANLNPSRFDSKLPPRHFKATHNGGRA